MIAVIGWFVMILLLCGSSVLFERTANAEPYVAGFAGYGLSAQLSDVKGSGDMAGSTGSNLGLQNSPIYGLKVGYFLDNLKYFGGEAEVYTATPYLKQQHFTKSGSGGEQTAIVPGHRLRVTTAAFNVVYRYPGEIVQPYAGAGLGLFWYTSPSSTAGSAIRPGLNVLAGVRGFMTKHIAAFGEYKFNQASFLPFFGGLKADYNAHFVVFGVGYHF
ncbi:MAG TPA: outer membrane beta-barrel protein [Nitrospiraceae bacterium]|nr:outer membrane beta-barrel protein [Nitrospiraceae bacterium]